MNNEKWKKLKKVYEEKVYPNLTDDSLKLKSLKQFFDNIDHNVYSVFSSELDKSLLFDDFDSKNDDDTFYGIYNGVKFKIVETELLTRKGNETKFKGIIITFSLNKKFKGTTVVLPKGILSGIWNFQKILLFSLFVVAFLMAGSFTKNPAFMFFGLILLVIIILELKYQKMQKVFLEDSVIKSICDVYSTDQVEGRYLLTPTFVERYKNLQKIFDNKKIRCSFYDNKVMFAIPTTKNYFEVENIENLNNDLTSLCKFYDEITTILELIDYFKLDEKTNI